MRSAITASRVDQAPVAMQDMVRGMQQFSSRSSNLLHARNVRSALSTEIERLPPCQHASRVHRQPGHGFRWTPWRVAVLVALVASVAGLTFRSTVVLSRVGRVSSAEASNDTRTEQPANIELAHALTAAINAHDVDALVELFTEEDAGPTVTAERFAWQKFEIRLWAQRQAEMNIRVKAHDYRLTEHGAAWTPRCTAMIGPRSV